MVSLGVIHLCLIMAMVGAATLVQQDSTQLVDVILLMGAVHTVMRISIPLSSQKLAHVQNTGETNGMLLLPALHGLQIVHKTEQGEMKHWR